MDLNFVAPQVAQQYRRGVQFQIPGWLLKSALERNGEALFVNGFEFRRVKSRCNRAPDFSLRRRKFSQLGGPQLQFAARAAPVGESRIAMLQFAVVTRLRQVRDDLPVATGWKYRVELQMLKWLVRQRHRAHHFDQVIENLPG